MSYNMHILYLKDRQKGFDNCVEVGRRCFILKVEGSSKELHTQ